jgi:hypothetical protein
MKQLSYDSKVIQYSMATRWNNKASNKVKQQVCETTSKNSNVKKQHKTPSLEQQGTKLSKQKT